MAYDGVLGYLTQITFCIFSEPSSEKCGKFEVNSSRRCMLKRESVLLHGVAVIFQYAIRYSLHSVLGDHHQGVRVRITAYHVH